MNAGVKNLRLAGTGFFCVLASYFVLLPLREDAVLQLGTDRIPALFTSSLIATCAVSPIAAVVGRRVLYAFSVALIGLYMLASSTWIVPTHPAGTDTVAEGPHLQPWVSALLYVTVNLMNLVATSTLWAACAKCFTPEAAKQSYGLLSAGATLGQLAGSATALVITNLLPSSGLRRAGGLPSIMLLSAALLLVAAQCMRHMSPPSQPHAKQEAPAVHMPAQHGALHSQTSLKRSRSVYDRARQAHASMRVHAADFVRVINQCATSPYLLQVCGFIGLSSMVSSMVYFERALVVSSQLHSAQRLRFFAVLNSITAFLILVLQVSLTAVLIRVLGVAGAASVSPALSLLGFSIIALHPVPNVVAGVEVVRKVVQYALARPTREVLFTVLSPAELSCKVMIDSLVGRAGDTVAAAMFEFVGVRLRWGPSRLAALGACLCAVWLLLTLRLGTSFKLRQARPLPVAARQNTGS